MLLSLMLSHSKTELELKECEEVFETPLTRDALTLGIIANAQIARNLIRENDQVEIGACSAEGLIR